MVTHFVYRGYLLRIERAEYVDGSMALRLVHADNARVRPGDETFYTGDTVFEGEEYGRLTVNLSDPTLGTGQAYVDVNNLGRDIVDVLIKAGIAKDTGQSWVSGFVAYPKLQFDLSKLHTGYEKEK